jgi:hypothetical protein
MLLPGVGGIPCGAVHILKSQTGERSNAIACSLDRRNLPVLRPVPADRGGSRGKGYFKPAALTLTVVHFSALMLAFSFTP